MIDLFSTYFSAYRNEELALIGIGLTIWGSLFFASFLPRPIVDLRQKHYWTVMFAVLIVSYTAIRIPGSVIAFSSPFEKVGWSITTFFLVLAGFVLTYITSIASDDKRAAVIVPYTLDETSIQLTVSSEGHGIMTRTQKLIPMADLAEIIEYDLYASGEITNIAIKIQESSDGRLINIPSEVLPGKRPEMEPLINKMLEGHRLKKDKIYTRVLTVNSPNSYVNAIGDALSVLVTAKTNHLRVHVDFTGPRSVDEESIELFLTHEKGLNPLKPKEIQCDLKDAKAISFVVYDPAPGNRYRLTWKYKAPSLTKSDEKAATKT